MGSVELYFGQGNALEIPKDILRHKFLFWFFYAGILISSFLEAQYRLYITENNFANG